METPQEKIAHLPHTPGVYLYRDSQGTILYIGKAKDLKKRVSQYWQRDAVGAKTQQLVAQISSIETIDTASEFDALLLEAKLIHENTPKYNAVLKDDKSPLYILLTLSETLPHVYTMRRSDLPVTIDKEDALFGPFQSARTARSVLRELRHIVPFCTQKKRTGQPCFYWHLGLCNPCPSDRTTLPREYRKNIFRLRDILSGKSTVVLKELESEMQEAAKTHNFETAADVRNHIQSLYNMLSRHYDPSVYTSGENAAETIYESELAELQKALSPYLPIAFPHRIECMDISNTSGQYATGSMVVLTDGVKDPSQYRRFRIRRKNVPNDFAMMAEIVSRRFRHHEWPFPDLLVIDGGKGQVKAAGGAPVPVVGLAKRLEEIIIPLPEGQWKTLSLPITSGALHVVERVRDEAHRFAIRYHRLLRKTAFGTITSA